MKVIITTAIILTFAVISCKKEASANTSNDLDSVTAHDNNNLPTNNSSAMPTDSLNTASQNASTQNAQSQDASTTGSSQKKQQDSVGTGKR